MILWALTDLCEGGALSERLKRRPPPAAARLERWWRDATAGLAATEGEAFDAPTPTKGYRMDSVDLGAGPLPTAE